MTPSPPCAVRMTRRPASSRSRRSPRHSSTPGSSSATRSSPRLASASCARSSPRIDAPPRNCSRVGKKLEARLGIDIDLRIFARLDARHDTFDRVAGARRPAPRLGRVARAQIAACCGRVASRRVQPRSTPQTRSATPTPDVALLRAQLPPSIPRVAVDPTTSTTYSAPAARSHATARLIWSRRPTGSSELRSGHPAGRRHCHRVWPAAALPASRWDPAHPTGDPGPARARPGRRMSSRDFKGRMRAEHEVESLLQTIFAAELIAPSKVIWLISPWISDVQCSTTALVRSPGSSHAGAAGRSCSQTLTAIMRRGSRW